MVERGTSGEAPPSLDEIAQNSQNLRETYKLLKRITLANLQSSEPSYRRRFVTLCLEKAGVSTDGDILVGFLLLSGVGLASTSTWGPQDIGLVERLCRCVREVDLETVGYWRALEGAYALTLVKNLNTVALGLLSKASATSTAEENGFGDDIEHTERVVLMTVACMDGVGRAAGGEVWIRVAKVVVAMAPHGRAVGMWMEAVGRILDGFENVRGIQMHGGDENRRVADVIEEGVSCVRRMMAASSSVGTSGESRVGVLRESVMVRVLSSVTWLYNMDDSRDGHAGVMAVGAVGKAMAVAYGTRGTVPQQIIDAFNAAMDRIAAVRAIDVKEMVWLAGVLYSTGRATRETGWLLKWSLRCSLAALKMAREICDETMVTRCCSDVVQCISVSSLSSFGADAFSSLLVEAIMHLRACGRDQDASSLMARVIKRAHLGHTGHAEQDDCGSHGGVLTARMILDTAYRSVKDVDLWLAMSKDAIGALASAMRETRRVGNETENRSVASNGMQKSVLEANPVVVSDRICLDAAQVVSFMREAFNPGKVPELHVEAVVACHAHIDAFPDLMSVDTLLEILNDALDKTKTKIGKKRIEDVAAVLEMLRVEAAVSSLLRASQQHGENVSLKRKEELQEDPTLIHSDEWIASDSLHESVAFMLKNSDQWQAVVNDATKALSGAGQAIHAMRADASQIIKEDLEAFVGLHVPESAAGHSMFWRTLASLDEGAEGMEGGEALSASMRHARSGNIYAALRFAIEGHRQAELRRKACLGVKGGLGSGRGSAVSVQRYPTAARWWTSLESHLIHSTWLGFLFSVCGLYNEARQAYSDGLRTSCQVGAAPLAAYFSVVLAELHLVGGNYARFAAHTGDAAKIVARGTMGLGSGSTEGPMGLLAAHVDIMRAAMDRHQLEFGLAASKLSRIEETHAPSSWYGARIAALAGWQQAMLERDQETEVRIERIERRLIDLTSSEYEPVLLGAPFAMMSVLLAQGLSVPFFDEQTTRHSGDHFALWAEDRAEGDKEASYSPEKRTRLAIKLGQLAANLGGSPFCQRTVLQLLAPLVAALGHKYASVALLHASSNPTLEIQQTLVSFMKEPTKGLACAEPHSPRLGASSCATLINALASDIASLEPCARSMVCGWTSKVPDVVICGIAVYDAATFGPLRPRRDRLILHRIRHGEIPLMIEVPSPEVQSSHPIHQLNGAQACGAVEFLGNRLRDILKRSNGNMRGVSAASSEADQRSWWRERVNLDHAMQQLLQELQTDWIGPWRCLFQNDDVPMAVEKGSLGKDEGESALLKRLLASARLSAMEIKSVSRLLSSLDIDAQALADEFQERLHVRGKTGPRQNPRAARKVSFTTLYTGEASPDLCSVVRSVAGAGMEDEPTGDGAAVFIADTSPISTQRSPPKTHVTVRRKHKSRLAHLQSLATPNPRRALGAHNFADQGYQTPLPKNAEGYRSRDDTGYEPMTVPVLPRKNGQSRENGLDVHEELGMTARTRGCVSILLVLDRAVQALPWESSFLMMNQADSADAPCREFYRVPSLPVALSSLAPATSPRQASSANKSLGSTYYVINPSGDLLSTQDTFESWFKNLKGWYGLSGRVPTADVLGAALQEHDLFIYCGHGGGEQYIPPSRLRALDSCASSVLMGCSSARLTAGGVYDADGVALSYLVAGAPAVVGNLWDVTDKDIDRYCTGLLNSMLENRRGKANLGELVQQCRLNCRLMYLIGASPVVYGLPVRFA